MNATTVAYGVSCGETLAMGRKIREWIAARQAEGWTVELSVRGFAPCYGVMWQCINDGKKRYQEFTPCIGMDGEEFTMN